MEHSMPDQPASVRVGLVRGVLVQGQMPVEILLD